ncbi:MAG: adenylyl-sulfate kinase [Desulfomonilaceae bacterium]|nr:adenylyl-sulfate kinase [Desulfomonilaceae bacterium]
MLSEGRPLLGGGVPLCGIVRCNDIFSTRYDDMIRHSGKAIWLTGLSGSGKSTLSEMLKRVLESRGVPVVLLDGDLLRQGLCRDLGFSTVDRAENIRRAGETAKLLSEAGHTVISAFITPLESIRRAVRGIFSPGRYVEIFLDCPLSVCEERDPKGLYCRARSGEIPEFTGISSPFERPVSPDLSVPTSEKTVQESLHLILEFLEHRFSDLRESCVVGRSVRGRARRVVVLGLDCVPPQMVFHEEAKDLHNLRALMDHGVWGDLRSTDPPITVPAWTTITTGRDPGELGIYGFRNRVDHGYDEMVVVNSSHVRARRVWHYLEDSGKSSILLGIPQTYPAQPHNGITVADFLSPDVESPATFPEDFARELHALAGGQYLGDVRNFRTVDKDRLLEDLYAMVDRRFHLACNLVIHRSWDFFMMVEMATDRLHHGFWRYGARDHRLYEPGNPYESVMGEFYKFLDSRIGSFLARLSDDTTVLVISDHGAQSMAGGVRTNEWLIRNGYLTLIRQPTEGEELSWSMIDWSRTQAWSEGGYYARVFLNIKGREPLGIVDPGDYEALRDELTDRLSSIPEENGRAMKNQVLKPQQLYRTCNNVPPDLIVYFDGLRRRSVGTVGGGDILCSGNDTGPDDSNHDFQGIFIGAHMSDVRAGKRNGTRIENASCMDVTPTILHEFGIPKPSELGGSVIHLDGGTCSADMNTKKRVRVESRPDDHSEETLGYSPEEAEIVKKRLMELGYL